jgi:hypothetical protein
MVGSTYLYLMQPCVYGIVTWQLRDEPADELSY